MISTKKILYFHVSETARAGRKAVGYPQEQVVALLGVEPVPDLLCMKYLLAYHMG
jgi:hypothetical protein